MNRRDTIIAGIATLAVASYLVMYRFGGPPVIVLTGAEKAACALTVEVTEGPYWVSGMPELKAGNLNATNLPGEALAVSGHVYEGAAGNKPVVNAEVEIWHADTTGNYHPNGNGPVSNYQPGDVALRGFVRTGADGKYQFTTIYAGEYSGRTRHIHFKIRVPGRPELTTQLIIPAKPGDALTFDTDTIAKGLPACQLLKVDATSTPASAVFDFRL
jgi:protocatechuate 3,4-dioxygenase beta subunit